MQGSTSVAFGYDNASRRTSATLPNGITAAYVYDAASELTSITYKTSGGTTLGTLTYTYGPDGWVTSRSGTLFTSVLPAAVMSSTYNAGNQLTARTTSGGTQSPTWDANGSLSSDGLNAYTWDARNRMTAIGSLASFVYDAFGRRVSATKSGTTTAYLYSGNDVVQELQGGSATANLLLGLGIDERLVRAGQTYLTDLLGSTIGLSNGSAIQTSYAYDPYGVATSAGTATTNAFQFTGRENDGTTAGLMFYRARFYNPSWGRFVSEDPIGIRGGINLYAYVGGQPTDKTDRYGQSEDELQQLEDRLRHHWSLPSREELQGKSLPTPSLPLCGPMQPISRLHSESTIMTSNLSSYYYWNNKSTDMIVDSLAPGSDQPLTANENGTIVQGNTRVLILEQRGIDINTLPCECK